MLQILILSGKGGTGKTTVASSFIKLNQAKAYADCDVDAPNLHLVSGHFSNKEDRDYFGLPKAVIDQDLCIGCNRCYEVCHFDAIVVKDGHYSVNPIACEGCSYCMHVCKANAITMHDEPAGLL
ncbi:MAG: ATPase, partial [Spirochaetia bacterium]|nr:ATPase [Spirochaetia bacterium]